MKLDNDWIDKIDEETISKLFQHKNNLEEIPENINKKILNNFNSILNEENTSTYKIRFIKKITMIAALLFILIIAGIILSIKYSPLIFNRNNLITKVIYINGEVNIQKNNKLVKLKIDDRIKSNEKIITGENSKIIISTGSNSQIDFGEKTTIELVVSKKINHDEIVQLKLENGKINCDVNLISKNSTFQIISDLSIISVKGTKFSVEYLKNDYLRLSVQKGIVEIKNNINLDNTADKIKDIDNELNNLINNTIESKTLVNQNDQIIINKKDQDQLITKIENIVKLIDNEFIINKKLSPESKNNLINDINSIKENNELNYNINNYESEKNNQKDNTNDKTKNEEKNLKIIKENKLENNQNNIIENNNNYIFIYKWNENKLLDNIIEKMKNEINKKNDKAKIYSIEENNIESYYDSCGNIIFFVTYNDLSSNAVLKNTIEKYLEIPFEEINKNILKQRKYFLSKIINHKRIIIYSGYTNDDLIESIENNLIKF